MDTLFYNIILVLVTLSTQMLSKNRRLVGALSVIFFALQGAGIAYIALQEYGTTHLKYFTFDALGLTYGALMSLMGVLVSWRSIAYLNSETIRQWRIYFLSLILLSASLMGVYMANDMAVGWIFLEATTLCTAGLIYHNRTQKALEATWKYLFVSSVGIAVAYLGVLLFATVGAEELSFEALRQAISNTQTNPLFMKLAFLLVLVGYSTKLEIFPLFTAPVDANHAAPAPASAFFSSALVGGGFVSIYRVYGVMMASSQAEWTARVLLLTAVLSLIVAAVYMGRTNNYKRLLTFSTVENGALSVLGLGLGGLFGSVGIFAALLHSIGHTLIKGVLFLQVSVAGKLYNTYKVGRIGNYARVDTMGSLVIVLALFSIIAVPPSLLFKSEFLLLGELLSSRVWWLIIPIAIALLTCLSWALLRFLSVVFAHTSSQATLPPKQSFSCFSLVLALILGVLFYAGVIEVEPLRELIEQIIVENNG